MIKILIAATIGAMVGIGMMCFMVVAAEEDRQLEKLNNRCKFCGGKLSEIRISETGKLYRYCYGCHFDYEVDE